MQRLALTLVLMLFISPRLSWGQAQTPIQADRGPEVFGSAELPPLVTGEEALPSNVILFSVAGETAYDDNVFSNNSDRHGDVTFGLSPRLALRQKRRRASLALDYQPSVLLYRRYSAYDATNQALQFDLQLATSPRLSFRLRDSADYMRGIFQPIAGQPITSGLTGPSQVNQTVYTPLLREFANTSRLDADYRFSRRTDIDFFGGPQEQHFSNNPGFAQNLFNMNGENAGVQFSDRLTKSSTLGLMYMYSNLEFGSVTHTIVQTGYFSWAQSLTPGLTLQLFGGPEYTHINEQATLNLGIVVLSHVFIHNDWHPTYGGTLTAQRHRTAFEFSARHAVMDGGGLLATVENTDFNAEVRQQVTRRWTVFANSDVARSRALELFLGGSKLNDASVGAGIERAFSKGLVGRLAYNFIRQRSNGEGIFLPDVNQNRVSINFYYQFKRSAI